MQRQSDIGGYGAWNDDCVCDDDVNGNGVYAGTKNQTSYIGYVQNLTPITLTRSSSDIIWTDVSLPHNFADSFSSSVLNVNENLILKFSFLLSFVNRSVIPTTFRFQLVNSELLSEILFTRDIILPSKSVIYTPFNFNFRPQSMTRRLGPRFHYAIDTAEICLEDEIDAKIETFMIEIINTPLYDSQSALLF